MQPEEVVIADLIRERDEAREQVRSLQAEVAEWKASARWTHSADREAAELREAVRGLRAEREKCQEWRSCCCARYVEEIRSLTVERDAARAAVEALDARWRVFQSQSLQLTALEGARARLSRAREALGSFDENPPPYRAGHLVEGEWRIHQARALAALRAALAEPPANG